MPGDPRIAVAAFALRVLALVGASTPLCATDYWVDGTRGQDVATGGTAAQPWRTLGFAMRTVPAPAAGTTHRVFLVGGQTYVIPTTIDLRDRIQVVGVGTQPPVLSNPTASIPLLRWAATNTYGTGSRLRWLTFERAATAIRIETAARTQDLGIEACTFRHMRQAALSVEHRGTATCSIEVTDCEVLQGMRGLDVQHRGSGRLNLAVERTRITRTSYEGAWIRNTGSGSLGTTVRFAEFDRCNRGLQFDSQGMAGALAGLVVHRSAFYYNQFNGVQIGLSRPALTRVDQCTFHSNDRGMTIHGALHGGAYTIESNDNYYGHSTYDGIQTRLTKAGTGTPVVQMRSRRHTIENNEQNWSLFVETGVTLDYHAEGIRSFRSNGMGASFDLRSAAARVALDSVVLAESARGALLVSGIGQFECRSSTLVDHYRSALDARQARNARFVNSIFAGAAQPLVLAPPSMPIDWCCFDGMTWPGRGNLNADPQLVTPHYKLAKTSPCIDRGDPSTAVVGSDFEGDARVLAGKSSPARIDQGADEYVPIGAARPFGTAGFGRNGISPRAVWPSAATGARIGLPLTLGVVGAIDAWGRPAPSAILGWGRTDRPNLDLRNAGAPGSQLWIDWQATSSLLRLDRTGGVTTTITLPNTPALIGAIATAQWAIIDPNANPLGAVTSDGLRITIGR